MTGLHRPFGRIPAILTALATVLAACNLIGPSVSTQGPEPATAVSQKLADTPTTAPSARAGQATPRPIAQHRIGVRTANGIGEFYDVTTGSKFTPRGSNYVFVPSGSGYTTTLLKVGTYDPQRTRADFARLSSLGYNTVRVFLDQCSKGTGCIGDSDNVGLNPAYLDNIADMTQAARQAGIFILFTSNDLPDQGGYAEQANAASGVTFAGYRNSYYLTPGAIAATRRYWSDVLTGLAERGAAFDAVLGWELLNEQWMFLDQPPLSLTQGKVTTTTGTYDMSDPDQKKRMVSEGLVFYIAQMKKEILAHDPTALVTMGFFPPGVAPGWYVETASLLRGADLDFFDFHAYPGGGAPSSAAEAFGMAGHDQKPILMGEYGAFRHVYSDLTAAARALTQWVADSCSLGFDGWLYWAYNPDNPEAGDRTWGLTDEDGYLLNLLAPANQPDPCTPLNVQTGNLAYGKPVRASAILAAEPAAQAVDENAASEWGAGAGAPQWIEVDLQGSYRINEIRLLVAQYPDGDTVHRILVRSLGARDYTLVHEFSGFTRSDDWLVFKPDTPLDDVQYVRISTVSSPSWVAWREIQVFGTPKP